MPPDPPPGGSDSSDEPALAADSGAGVAAISSPEVEDGTFHRRRLARGGAVVLIGTIVQKAANLGLVAVLARELGVDGFGVYLFALSYGLIFEILSDFGLDWVITRELNVCPPADRGRVVGSAIVAKTAAIAVTVVIALGVAFVYEDDLRAGALIASVGLLAGIPGTFGVALKARVDNLRPVLITTLSAVLGAATVLVAQRRGVGPVGLVTIQVGFRLASSAVALPLMRRRLAYHLSYDWAESRRLIRASAPLAVSIVAAVIFFRVDQLLLAGLSQLRDVGSYGASLRLVDGINVVPIAISTVFLPTLSHLRGRDDNRSDRLAARGVKYLAAIILPLAALATVFGDAILRVAFGSEFQDSGEVLAVLLWAHFFGAVWLLGRPALVAHDRLGYLAVLSILGAAINVALNVTLIPSHGATGAAVASLVSYAVPYGVGAFFGAVRRPFVAPLGGAARPLAASAIVLAALWFVPEDELVAGLAVFAVATPLALALTRTVSVSEIRDLAVSFGRSS